MHLTPRRTLATAGALTGALALTVPLLAGSAGAATRARHPAVAKPELAVHVVKAYGHILADAAGDSLYVLSAEAHGKVVCKGACLKIWPPLLVPTAVKKVALGAGVKGKIGFVARSPKEKQVTFNGYPLYTFKADTKPGQANGEGIVHFGGTWFLANPAATTTAATAIHKAATTSATKTKSGGSGGSGW